MNNHRKLGLNNKKNMMIILAWLLLLSLYSFSVLAVETCQASMVSLGNSISDVTYDASTNVEFGDFDNDGILDIIGVDTSEYPVSKITWYKGLGNYSFIKKQFTVPDSSLREQRFIAVGDFDNDGNDDFASNRFVSGVG